jgi:putative transposase
MTAILDMPSTYLSLHYHLVFSTKNRLIMIGRDWQTRFHEYLGGTINGLDGQSEGVGGTEDYVYLLESLKSTPRLADFMGELKKASSSWVHREIGDPKFALQECYGAFSLSPTACAGVKAYIRNQEEHHRTKSFCE